MKKKMLAFLLAAMFVLTLVMSVSAEGVQCDLSGTKTVQRGQRHYCALSQLAYRFKRYYQKCEGRTIAWKFAFWFWNTEGGPWTRTVNSGVAQFDNAKVVSGGTYRVKSVFTVTTKGWQVRNDYYVQQ